MMEEEEETLFDQENLLNNQKDASEERSLKQRRFRKTLAISMAFFCLGLCIAIPGPTLIELGRNVQSNTEHMSYIFTARSVGYLIGSVVGGILFDFFDQQLLLFYTLATTAIATVGIPWCSALLALSLLICVQGIAVGVLDTGGNVFCIKIWGRKSAPYMQLLHFCFGVGAFLAPLIVDPFFLGNSGFNQSAKVGPYMVQMGVFENIHLQVIASENSSLSRHTRESPLAGLSVPLSVDSVNSIIKNGYFGSVISKKNQATIDLEYPPILFTSEKDLNTPLSAAPNDSAVPVTTEMSRPQKPKYYDGDLLVKAHADSIMINRPLQEMLNQEQTKPRIRSGFLRNIRSRRQAAIEPEYNTTESSNTSSLSAALKESTARVTTALKDSTIPVTTEIPRRKKPTFNGADQLSKDHSDGDIINKKLQDLRNQKQQNPVLITPQPSQTNTTVSLVTQLSSNRTFDNTSDAQNNSWHDKSPVDYPGAPAVSSPNTTTSTEATTTTTSTTETTSSSTTTETTSSSTTTETTSSSTTTETTTTSTLPPPTTTTTTTSASTATATAKSDPVQRVNIPDGADGPSTPASTNHIYKPSATFDKISSNSSNMTKPEALDRSLFGHVIEELKTMSKIKVAYLIIGLFLALNAGFFLFLHYQDLHSKISIRSLSQVDLTRQPDSRLFRFSLLGLLFLFFYVYVGLEVTFGGLITTFAEDYKVTVSKGATLAALFWGCLASGRGISIIIARYFKPPCMIVANLILIIFGSCLLSFITLSSSKGLIWFGTIVFGLGMSSIYPTAISWADSYYPLTGKATAVFVAGSGIGEMTLPLLTAYLYQNVDRMSLMYMCLTLSSLLALLYINLQVLACRRTKTTGRSHSGFMRLQNSEEMADEMDMNTVRVAENGLTETLRRRDVNSTDDDKRRQNGGSYDVTEFTKLMELSD